MFEKKINDIDAVAYQSDSSTYLPFIGNGYVGASISQSESLLLYYHRDMIIKSQFYPFVDLKVSNYFQQEKYLLDFTSGMFLKFNCYKQHFQASLCIAVTSTYYAHRTRPELIVQSIKVHNPTKAAIQIELQKQSLPIANIKLKKEVRLGGMQVYQIYQQTINYSNDSSRQQRVLVIFAKPIIAEYFNVPLSGDKQLDIITGVKFEIIPQKLTELMLNQLSDRLTNDLIGIIEEAIKSTITQLNEEHKLVWNNLWKSGISIEKSLFPGAINGHHINSTIYYLLSQVPAYLSYRNITNTKLSYYQNFMNQTLHCYNSHDTLYAVSLWQPVVSSSSQLLNQFKRWIMLLHKNGCGLLTRAGADGVMQALIHSAGAFMHQGDHISFGMKPGDLQRPLIFRHMFYNDHFSNRNKAFRLAIDLDEDNRPRMWVSMTSSTKLGSLYACDAGCVDEPVLLSEKPVLIPVKLTHPIQPLLHISSRLSRIYELRQVIHITSIEDAPPHQHHLIVLHRHGQSSWAGLPPIFWIFIVFLVLIFHLALCKLIYSEYCRYKDDYDLSITDDTPSHNRRYKYSSGSQADYHYMPSTRRSHYYNNASSIY